MEAIHFEQTNTYEFNELNTSSLRQRLHIGDLIADFLVYDADRHDAWFFYSNTR